MSKLYFIYSPMSSGKTATLLMKAYAFEKNGIPVMCMKPEVDTRDGYGVIKSRVGLERKCYVINKDMEDITILVNEYMADTKETPSWILVDEAQFLTEKQVDWLAWYVDNFNVNVICYGLRTDFQGKLFEGSRRLFEMADSVDELKSTCKCGRKAIINARIDENGRIVTNGEQVEVGGNDRYVTLCRKCYNKLINEQN
jgi:thymidine kinase